MCHFPSPSACEKRSTPPKDVPPPLGLDSAVIEAEDGRSLLSFDSQPSFSVGEGKDVALELAMIDGVLL